MDRRLNIVIATDTCEIDGGAALVALEDAKTLAREGHRVIFFSACGRVPEEHGGIEWISLGQNNILDEPNRLKAAWNGLWNLSAARGFADLLGRLPKDLTVVHVHSWSKALSGSVIATARRRGFKIVCTLHDYFSICPNGGLYDYPVRQVCLRRPMSASCVSRNCDSRAYIHKVWRVLRQLIWRHCAGIPRSFDAMLAVSDFSARKIMEVEKGRSINVVDNLPTLMQERLSPMSQRSVIAYAGRVAAEKGVDLYLAACRHSGVSAVVWGDGPLLPDLRRHWPEASFSGWLSKPELSRRLPNVVALVMPSLWYENSPMMLAEAAAVGIPVIVSDHGAPATLVENGVTGLHFRAGDVGDLSEKIALLHRDQAYAYSMGQNAYQRFWRDYSKRRSLRIAQIMTCYYRLLGDRP